MQEYIINYTEVVEKQLKVNANSLEEARKKWWDFAGDNPALDIYTIIAPDGREEDGE